MPRRHLASTLLALAAVIAAASTSSAADPFADARKRLTEARAKTIAAEGLATPMRFALMTPTDGDAIRIVETRIDGRLLNSVPDTLRLVRDLWLDVAGRRPAGEAPAREQAVLMAYRPKEKIDMHAIVDFKGLELTGVRFAMIPKGGEAVVAEGIRDDDDFRERFGRHFNLRAAWRHLVGQTMRGNRVQTHAVADDYILLFSPPVRTPMQRANMEGQIADRVDAFAMDYPDHYLIALVDVDKLPFVVSENYHGWLGTEAKRVRMRQVKADALIAPDRFMRLATERIRNSGDAIRLDGGVCVVGDDDIHVRIALTDALVKTVHAGLNFEQGIRHYICRPLARLPEMKALYKAITERLAEAYLIEPVMGHRLLFTDRMSGKVVRRSIDLADMAARVDPADEEAVTAYLERAAAFDPATGRFATRNMTPGEGNVPYRAPLPKNEAQVYGGLGYRVTFDEDFGYIVLVAFPDGSRVPLTRDDFKGDDEALDTIIEKSATKLTLPVKAHGTIRVGGKKAYVAAGPDLATVWTDRRLARNLLATLLPKGEKPPRRTYLFAVSQNVVVFAPRRLKDDELEPASAAALGFARGEGVNPGPALFAQQSMRLPREGAGTFTVKEK